MTEVKFRSDIKVELLDMMGSEERIAQAARVSTKGRDSKESKSDGLVRTLVEEGHTVPLEHCVLTFRIEAPLSTINQLVKHRMTSISAHSARYSEFRPEFHVPAPGRPVGQTGRPMDYNYHQDDELHRDAVEERQLVAQYGWDSYQRQLKQGIAKEVARDVLPPCLYTSVVMTLNLHSALNMVKLRTPYYGSHPQYEIAQIGEEIQNVLYEKFPTVMEAFDSPKW